MGSDLLRSDKSNLLSEVIMARLKIRADSKVLRRREKNQEQEGSVRVVRIDYRAYVIGPDILRAVLILNAPTTQTPNEQPSGS